MGRCAIVRCFCNCFVESGQNGEQMSRDVLTTKLGVMDDAKTAKIPLLYYIVAAFQNIDEE